MCIVQCTIRLSNKKIQARIYRRACPLPTHSHSFCFVLRWYVVKNSKRYAIRNFECFRSQFFLIANYFEHTMSTALMSACVGRFKQHRQHIYCRCARECNLTSKANEIVCANSWKMKLLRLRLQLMQTTIHWCNATFDRRQTNFGCEIISHWIPFEVCSSVTDDNR